MTSLIQDIRYGLRTLGKSPGFTIVAVVTLALGIGANTAIFSIVNAVLLKPLPVPEPDRLLLVTSAFSNQADANRPFAMSYPDFFDMRAAAKSFTGLASYHGDNFTLTGLAQPLHVTGSTVSGDFFSVIGKQPFLGRGFTRERRETWVTRCGAQPSSLGLSLSSATAALLAVTSRWTSRVIRLWE